MTTLITRLNKLVTVGLRIRSLSVGAVLCVLAGPVVGCTARSSPLRSAVVLGTADTFTVLGGSTVTNTGPTTVVGNLGVAPGLAVTGFPPGIVTGGSIHAGDAVALQAQNDVTTAYNALAAEACGHNLTGQDLGGLTLTPGVYCLSSSAQLTGTLTLDAQGNPDADFVFQIGSTLTTASSAHVLLINGAQSCHVFWQVGSSATLGTTTMFVGNVLALTSITLNTGVQVLGRALARNGAVTLDTNNLAVGTCAVAGGPDAGVPDAGRNDGGATDGAMSGGGDAGGGGGGGGGGSDSGGGGGGGGGGGSDGGHSCDRRCGDICVDIQTDNDNCGACGHRCSWDLLCVAGSCSVCMETTCGRSCVNLDDNPDNCGACGNACAANQRCEHGSCTTMCGGAICDGWCTNLMTNDNNCGACGHKCGAAESCTNGVCVCTGTMCGSVCEDLSSSASNCGSCGHACGTTECCKAGTCKPL